MDWTLFFTVVAQVAIGSLVFVLIAVPVGWGISHLTYGVLRPIYAHKKPEVSQEELDQIAEDILDRIVVIGKNDNA